MPKAVSISWWVIPPPLLQQGRLKGGCSERRKVCSNVLPRVVIPPGATPSTHDVIVLWLVHHSTDGVFHAAHPCVEACKLHLHLFDLQH